MAHDSFSSSSSLSHVEWKYDVFLSFRGEDTRNKFTDHLYVALDQKRFITFMDDERLERGRSIASELLEAIEKSRLSIVIFSKNYASSTWCLDELVKIAECMETRKQYVVPVFYYIDPSDVQNQKGDMAKDFIYYEKEFKDNMDRIQRWREALTKVASISGWHLFDSPEAQLIRNIVTEISRKLIRKWKYGVFVSFRGEDTRNTFTAHLYNALDLNGIKTFRDDDDDDDELLGRRQLEAIQQSRLSIIIFSKNYASSAWCLDELVTILECMHKNNQTVFPIFYDVEPWEVRNQREPFEKHYERFKGNEEKVHRWREALRQVCNLSGWILQHRSESKFIKDIVDEISKRTRGTFL